MTPTRWVETRFVQELQHETDFLRVRFHTERGIVQRFTVQYEAFFGERLFPVVRYDTAHGQAHRDLLDWDGSVVQKTWFPGEPYGSVMTKAIAEVRADWPRYRRWFEQRQR